MLAGPGGVLGKFLVGVCRSILKKLTMPREMRAEIMTLLREKKVKIYLDLCHYMRKFVKVR